MSFHIIVGHLHTAHTRFLLPYPLLDLVGIVGAVFLLLLFDLVNIGGVVSVSLLPHLVLVFGGVLLLVFF